MGKRGPGLNLQALGMTGAPSCPPGDLDTEQRTGTDGPESQALIASALPLACCVTWGLSPPVSGPPFSPLFEEGAGLAPHFSSSLSLGKLFNPLCLSLLICAMRTAQSPGL